MSPSILPAKRIGEARVVEEIEELDPELRPEAFAPFEVLGERKIDISESGVAENVAAHRAFGARRRAG